jgi:hypothetical protein
VCSLKKIFVNSLGQNIKVDCETPQQPPLNLDQTSMQDSQSSKEHFLGFNYEMKDFQEKECNS